MWIFSGLYEALSIGAGTGNERGLVGEYCVRLDPYIRNYTEFVDELSGVVDAPSTRIYVDTSMLMWLVRLGSAARGEFFAWADSRRASSVHVPVWCAHEFHTHLVRNSIEKTLRDVANDLERKFEDFSQFAAERADNAICIKQGFTGRDDFIAQVQSSLSRMRRIGKVVHDATELSTATDEVIAFINAHIMATDLAPIIEDVTRNGETRYSHLMPPGFHDKKSEDRFGDLIIWLEIAADMPKPRKGQKLKPAAVLISRDAKTDWVSSAPRILDDKEKPTKPNREQGFDVILPHPLLTHEFALRASGSPIYIAHPGILAAAITATDPNAPRTIGRWLAAAYRPDHVAAVIDIAGKFGTTKARPEANGEGPADNSPPLLADTGNADTGGDAPAGEGSANEGGKDELAEAFAVPALSDVLSKDARKHVANILDLPPHERSEKVAGWIAELLAGNLSPAEAGARLASFHSLERRETELPAIMDSLAGELALASRRKLALAIAAHAFFYPAGNVRRPPLMKLAAILVNIAEDPALAPAFAALSDLLKAAGATLLHVPGTGGKVAYELDLAEGPDKDPRRIRAIKIAGENVYVAPEDGGRGETISSLVGADQCSGLDLRLTLARHYAIAPGVLATSWDKKRIRWDADAGLAELDPEAPGGVSPIDSGD